MSVKLAVGMNFGGTVVDEKGVFAEFLPGPALTD